MFVYNWNNYWCKKEQGTLIAFTRGTSCGLGECGLWILIWKSLKLLLTQNLKNE